MGATSFEAVRSTEWWWLHQITQGIKALPVGKSAVWESQSEGNFPDDIASQGVPVPAV